MLQLRDNSECSLRLITDDISITQIIAKAKEQDTFIFDHTKLSAINTCPTWGIARYGKHLTLGIGGRSTALDAGTACHKYFHALRLWHILHNQRNEEAYLRAGSRLFGRDYVLAQAKTSQDSDKLTNAINFCLPFLHDSGYYDDPNDKRRTLANLEQTCIAYTERRLRGMLDVVITDKIVGIEVPFAIEITRRHATSRNKDTQQWLLIGKIDGLHVDNHERLHCEENKTVALGWGGDSWRLKWHVDYQPTGYMVAAELAVGRDINFKTHLTGTVYGAMIPLPKNVFEGINVEPVERTSEDLIRWLEWQVHTIYIYNKYKSDLTTAPRYTHSCSRYNKPCAMIPFCSASFEEQLSMLDDGSFQQQPWVALEDEVIE